MSSRVHLVYPHGPRIATPDVIGRRVGEHLSNRHDVVLHDWDELAVVRPEPGDILLGHPHPLPGTVFRRSFSQDGWARRVVLSPFVGDMHQVAFLDPFVRGADAFLAITGRYWMEQVPATTVAHWAPRMIHLDLATDRTDFPLVKHTFAPKGQRKFLYIGHTGWYKNVGYLSEIARARPDWHVGWIGPGQPSDIPGVEALGVRDTSSQETRDLLSTYDFLITVGTADANPTTILEAMAWGLLPVCTAQSGYVREPGVINVPLDDVAGVIATLERWQRAPGEALVAAQQSNLMRLEEHYNWERFCRQVEDAFTCELQPTLPIGAGRRAALAAAALGSPYGPFRPPGLRAAVGTLRRRLRAARAG